ncbi:MAG: SusC/RagA family TonB-linked outer membrane protein [Candidatus Cryptobacteroides sp.]
MMKRIIPVLFALLLGNLLYAQKITVKGTVTDDSGQPVIQVVVQEVNGQAVGVTDIDGNYSISVPSGAVLKFSCLGYVTAEVPVQSRAVVNCVLAIDNQVLDDVIVVAFGTATKESFTGSATVVNSEKIAERQVSSPIAALNGQVAGLQMVEGNGPDSDPSIIIRGFGSINAGTAPLIVLDGLPYNGYWSDINPQDVENISVLKDAASNALYGARGANGVIMITTKSAKRGRANISFDAKFGVNTDGRVYYDYISDPAEYYEFHYSTLLNYYRTIIGDKYSTAKEKAMAAIPKAASDGGLGYLVYEVPAGQTLFGDDGKLNPNATYRKVMGNDGKEHLLVPDNWRKEGMRNGFRQEYNLNISGGNENFQFIGSLGYLSNQGLTYGSDYTRITARAKADYQAREWLKVGVNMNYTNNQSNNLTNAFSVIYSVAPIYPLYIRDGEGNIMTDSHGKVFDYGDGMITGIVRTVENNVNSIQNDLLDKDHNDSNAFGLQGYADIKFFRDLTLTVNASIYDTENRTTVAYNPFYGYEANTGGGVSTNHYRTFDFNAQQLLKYKHSFTGGHNIDLLLGHEYNKNTSTTTGGSKTNIFAYEVNTELDGTLIKESIVGNKEVYNTEGFLFRGQYDYNGKYFASASYRLDGSSAFDPSNRWGSFWSVGGAWILSKERWFRSKAFDMFKFKASYGVQGNDGIPAYYYTRTYDISTVDSMAATVFKSQGNKDITWESNGNFNTGIEAEMFGGRLSAEVNYYYRITSDMLLWKTVPLGMGYGGYYDNVGDMVNQGVELNLSGAMIRTKNVVWSANLNLSHNKNEVTYLPATNKSREIDGHGGYLSGYRYVGENLPLYTWYVKKYAGVNEEGLSTWYKSDGTTTTVWDNAAYYLCGDPHPVIYGGFGTSLNAHGFDLSVNFLYSVGGKVMDNGYASLMGVPYAGVTGGNYHKDMLKAWSSENTDTDIPRAVYNDQNVNATSDRFLVDGSSLTFKNASMGYTFPSKLMDKIKVSSLRIYVSCDNIYYWSRRKGLDPRTSLIGDTDKTAYSPMRSISAGINVKF